MALTNEEKQELLNAMKAESQGVDELEQVDTLDGIMSLPALRGEEVVSAPIKLLTKPAEDAVAQILLQVQPMQPRQQLLMQRKKLIVLWLLHLWLWLNTRM